MEEGNYKAVAGTGSIDDIFANIRDSLAGVQE